MEITEQQNQKIAGIAKKYGLRLILLFGSRVSGTLNKESDFDVAYLPKKLLSFNKEVKLNYEFTEIFGNDHVDTVDLSRAKPLLLYGIFKQPRILFQIDNLIFSRYRAYAFKKYVESKPLYELKFRYI